MLHRIEPAEGGRTFGRNVAVPLKINTLGITGPQDLYFVYREPQTDSIDGNPEEVASADVALVFVVRIKIQEEKDPIVIL